MPLQGREPAGLSTIPYCLTESPLRPSVRRGADKMELGRTAGVSPASQSAPQPDPALPSSTCRISTQGGAVSTSLKACIQSPVSSRDPMPRDAELVELVEAGQLDLELQRRAVAAPAGQRHQQPGVETVAARRLDLAADEVDRARPVDRRTHRKTAPDTWVRSCCNEDAGRRTGPGAFCIANAAGSEALQSWRAVSGARASGPRRDAAAGCRRS